MWTVILVTRDGLHHNIFFDSAPDQHAIVECLLYLWTGGRATGYAK